MEGTLREMHAGNFNSVACSTRSFTDWYSLLRSWPLKTRFPCTKTSSCCGKGTVQRRCAIMRCAVERSSLGGVAFSTLAPSNSWYCRQNLGVSLVFSWAPSLAIQQRSRMSALSGEHCCKGRMNQFWKPVWKRWEQNFPIRQLWRANQCAHRCVICLCCCHLSTNIFSSRRAPVCPTYSRGEKGFHIT